LTLNSKVLIFKSRVLILNSRVLIFNSRVGQGFYNWSHVLGLLL
jgi:hypothetical protein